MDVRSILCGVVGVCLALASSNPVRSQDPPEQFFSGAITALSDTSITVTRTVLGKESSVRTFSITPETIVQGGKPKLKSKVTVKWVSGEGGDHAVKIILRATAPPPKKP